MKRFGNLSTFIRFSFVCDHIIQAEVPIFWLVCRTFGTNTEKIYILYQCDIYIGVVNL